MTFLIRFNLILSFLIGFSAIAFAQKTLPANLDAPLDKALLWELKGKGIRTSYIYGTIHIIPAEDFFLAPKTVQCLNKSKQLVLEMDMSNPMAMGLEMFMLAPMKDKKTLSDLLSPEDYNVVKNYFNEVVKGQGMSFEMMESWKPMLLQTMLYEDGLGFKDGSTKSYEMELMSMAKEKKMTFGGLEKMSDQMSIFDQIPYKDQAQELVNSIRALQSDTADSAFEMDKVVEFYKNQDIEGMVEMTDTEYKDIENAAEILLNGRNRKWIAHIREFSAKKTTFFAVGAGHLGGASGIIKLLIKEGYTLTPLH